MRSLYTQLAALKFACSFKYEEGLLEASGIQYKNQILIQEWAANRNCVSLIKSNGRDSYFQLILSITDYKYSSFSFTQFAGTSPKKIYLYFPLSILISSKTHTTKVKNSLASNLYQVLFISNVSLQKKIQITCQVSFFMRLTCS